MNFFQKIIISFILKKPASIKAETNAKGVFFSFAKKIILFMPEKEEDVKAALPVIDALVSKEKRLVIFVFSAHHHFIKNHHLIQVEQYFETVKNKFDLPKKDFRLMLADYECDAVIDLNRNRNVFSAVSSNFIKSNNYIGFKRNKLEKFFNILVEDSSPSALLSYENLLNCLKMF